MIGKIVTVTVERQATSKDVAFFNESHLWRMKMKAF